ncbi:MAG TPA: FHA domain-containing protein [Armatimonadota bacterium]|nr:FHA domain-containing protein [Armatimonadota bacterium]
MPICLHCGASNPDEHRFCKDCGAPLTATGQGEVDDDTIIIQLLEARGLKSPRAEHIARLWLLDLTGEHVERVYELSDEQVLIGRRDDCAVCLSGNTISRRHAQIRHEDGQFYLSDMGSTNGTMLNGETLIGEEQLRDRDEIGVGIYKLIFRLS